MGGYSADPRARLGLIALLAARRVKAETLRRAKAKAASSPQETEKAEVAADETRRSGWFR